MRIDEPLLVHRQISPHAQNVEVLLGVFLAGEGIVVEILDLGSLLRGGLADREVGEGVVGRAVAVALVHVCEVGVLLVLVALFGLGLLAPAVDFVGAVALGALVVRHRPV